MNPAATAETPRPPQQEVDKVTSVSQMDSKVRQDIEEILQKVGVPPDGKGLGVTPHMEQPVLTPSVVKAVGAVNIGHEEPSTQIELETLKRDVDSSLKGWMKKFFSGGHTENRAGPATWFRKMLRKKVASESKIGPKDIVQKDF